MTRLTTKVALVTGGSRGIGAAIAGRLAQEGAAVAFTYSNSVAEAADVAAAIRQTGQPALALQADSRDPQAIVAAVQQTVAELGSLAILVNNAGIYRGKPFVEHTLADYDDLMRAVYLAALAAVPYLPAGGRIISIGSNMAENALAAETTLYTMSKAAPPCHRRRPVTQPAFYTPFTAPYANRAIRSLRLPRRLRVIFRLVATRTPTPSSFA